MRWKDEFRKWLPKLSNSNLIVFHLLGFFSFFSFGEKNPVYLDTNVSEGYEVTSELPGRPATCSINGAVYKV